MSQVDLSKYKLVKKDPSKEESSKEDLTKTSPKSSTSTDSGIVPGSTPENEKQRQKRKRITYIADDSDNSDNEKDNHSHDDSADEFFPSKKEEKRTKQIKNINVSDDDSNSVSSIRRSRPTARRGRIESSDSSPNSARASSVDELGDFAFDRHDDGPKKREHRTSRSKSKATSNFEKELKILKEKYPRATEAELRETLSSVNSVFKADKIVKEKLSKLKPEIPDSPAGNWISLPKKLENNPYLSNIYKIPLVKREADPLQGSSGDGKTHAISSSSSDDEITCVKPVAAPSNLKKFFARTTLLKPSAYKPHVPKPTGPKTKRRFAVIESSDDEDEPKIINKKKPSCKPRPEENEDFIADDEEEIVECISSDEEDEYEKENFLSSSSDDEEGEGPSKKASPIKRPKKQRPVKKDAQPAKVEVVKFLQEAEISDLQTIPGVSRKKAEIIINLRPYEDYQELKTKIDNARGLGCDLLDNASKTIKSRDVVGRIMSECESLSDSISLLAKNLKPTKQPNILNKEMKLSEYQLIGLNWLLLMHRKSTNAILADEMGLGKTIQVIALLAALRENNGINGPHLIVVPSSTLDNWDREMSQWCPKLEVVVYYGSQLEREEIRTKIFSKEWKYDVILTTYTIVQSNEDKALFKRVRFEYAVFDEAHMLKNMKSARYEQLMRIQAKQRLLLTGTPMQNNLLELMSLLIFTVPDLFEAKTDHVKNLFTGTLGKNQDNTQTNFEKEKIELAKKIMSPFILRRLKKDVLKQLPQKLIETKICSMTPTQEKKYELLIRKYTREINSSQNIEEEEFEDNGTDVKRGAGMLMNLRKVANHPLLIRTIYTDTKLRKLSKLILKEPQYATEGNEQFIFEDMQVHSDFEMHALCCKFPSLSEHRLSDDHLIESGKFKILDEMLPALKEKNERVLIFSQFTMVLDILEEYLRVREHVYCRLDGSTKVSDRLDLIDDFNSDDSGVFVFLLSTKAGGMGINLTSANHCIIHDIDFNPYNDKQAEDRCHRIGQTKDVQIVKLIAKDSVEEGMLKIANEKLKLAEDLCDQAPVGKKEDSKDMKTLLRQVLGV